MIRFAVTAALLLASAPLAWGQESNEQKRDKKLKSPFLQKAPWFTDFDKALAESRKSSKPIFGYFTRSYSP